jgi:hypothetical protein
VTLPVAQIRVRPTIGRHVGDARTENGGLHQQAAVPTPVRYQQTRPRWGTQRHFMTLRRGAL